MPASKYIRITRTITPGAYGLWEGYCVLFGKITPHGPGTIPLPVLTFILYKGGSPAGGCLRGSYIDGGTELGQMTGPGELSTSEGILHLSCFCEDSVRVEGRLKRPPRPPKPIHIPSCHLF